MKMPTQAEIKVKDLEKKLANAKRAHRSLKNKFDTEGAKVEKFARARVLLDNLVRSAETGDITAVEQTAGAGREFLDQNPV
jgi:multidrug resistance efflux pump